MGNKMNLYLLILCAALVEIATSLSRENIEISVDLLVRKKRLIDRTSEAVPRRIKEFPYIVNVLSNGFRHCAGTILTKQVVVTLAECVEDYKTSFKYRLYSVASASDDGIHGIHHNITNIFVHPEYNKLHNNIALLIVYPYFNLINSPNRRIKLSMGKLIPSGTTAFISGWGHIGMNRNRPIFPTELRSIMVSTISQDDCKAQYRGILEITDEFICTYDALRHTGMGDFGDPLVISGLLVGMFVWKGSAWGHANPDVFIKLTHFPHRNWILLNIEHYT